MQQQQQQEQQQELLRRDGSGGDQGQHPQSSSSSSAAAMPPRPPPPDPPVLLSPAQARRLLDDARGLASGGRPVAALQALLAALAALGAPRAALQTFETAVDALLRREGDEPGGRGGQQQRPGDADALAPPPASLASLLASLSLEASTRLGALEVEEQEGAAMALDDREGAHPAGAAAAAAASASASAAASALLSEEAAARADGASVRCEECGAVVAATRAEAHALFWCSSLGSSGSGGGGAERRGD